MDGWMDGRTDERMGEYELMMMLSKPATNTVMIEFNHQNQK